MAFRFDLDSSVQSNVRRIADEQLADALARLERVTHGHPEEIEDAVHEVRKRCKEVRGLLRLVRPALGKHYARANSTIRDAANELSSLRDAQALLSTFDELRAVAPSSGVSAEHLDAVRQGQEVSATAAMHAVHGGDARIDRAHALLTMAVEQAGNWRVPDRFDSVGDGLSLTYGRGRKGYHKARKRPTDERMHEWRKRVKYLWYQTRLLEPVAPSMLAPLVKRLDGLADALGDDHDLSVLIEAMENEPKRFGGRKSVRAGIDLSRRQQEELRRRAFVAGSRIYAESTTAFVARVGAYWDAAHELGPELRTGSIEHVAAEAPVKTKSKSKSKSKSKRQAKPPSATVERERKFLVNVMPELPLGGDQIRQGYVAVDGNASLRVRCRNDDARTLTVKAGIGAKRTEVERRLDAAQFDALWPEAERRSITKTRYEIVVGSHTAELDVFEGALEGLRMVEVEFDSDAAMFAFEPPDWFGTEVTEDERFTNAFLAVHGLAGLKGASGEAPKGAVAPIVDLSCDPDVSLDPDPSGADVDLTSRPFC